MTPYDRAYRLEMSLRAAYLATERLEMFWLWVDAGLTRLAIKESITRKTAKKYAPDAQN